MAEKSKEQTYELPGEKTEFQGHMIKKIQSFMDEGNLSSQVADFLPYPIAIFTPRHTLVMVNKAFWEATKTGPIDLEKRVFRLLKYRIDDTRLAAAITKVFEGETFLLEDLKNPFSMFYELLGQSTPTPEGFGKALVFPVTGYGEHITHGVIVFMP